MLRIDYVVTKKGQRYLELAKISDSSILIDPLNGYFSNKSNFCVKRMSREQRLEAFTDMLLDRTSALLKVSTFVYHDKIAAAFKKELENN